MRKCGIKINDLDIGRVTGFLEGKPGREALGKGVCAEL